VSTPVIPPTPNVQGAPTFATDPTQLRAGDSWQWMRTFGDYPSGQGWSLQYVLNSNTSRFAFPSGSITPDADGQGFDIAVTPAQTASVPPGTYDLYAILTLTEDEVVTAQETRLLQSVLVTANIAGASAGIDTRSFVKKTLDALEAAIAGDQSPMVQEYEISGRRIAYMDRAKLKELRDQYAYEYQRERAERGEFVEKRKVELTFRPSY
jgi:hypothetical protein